MHCMYSVCKESVSAIHSIVCLNVHTHIDILCEPSDQFREFSGSCSHQLLLISLIHPLIQLGCAVHSSWDVELVIWCVCVRVCVCVCVCVCLCVCVCVCV